MWLNHVKLSCLLFSLHFITNFYIMFENSLNATFAHIPRKDGASEVKYYRPISLVGSAY